MAWLAKRREWQIRNKNGLWRPYLLTDRDEMSNLYRGHSVDASYQVSVQLAKRFQRWWFIKNRPIRNKNCLWRPCLLMDWDKMSKIYQGHSIDASYQVSGTCRHDSRNWRSCKWNRCRFEIFDLVMKNKILFNKNKTKWLLFKSFSWK
jgi:hypothetical protein